MKIINSLSNTTISLYKTDVDIKEINKEIKMLVDSGVNDYAMRFMYNEWMQKTLLSDGLDPDENYDW